MKQNRIKMPQLQFVSIVLLRSGFIPINNLKSGRTLVNTVKTPVYANWQILEILSKDFSFPGGDSKRFLKNQSNFLQLQFPGQKQDQILENKSRMMSLDETSRICQ